MKAKIVILAMTGLFSTAALAQNSSTMDYPSLPRTSSEGIRVGLVKPTLKADFKVKFNGGSGSKIENMDNALGVSVGYAHIPNSQFGWTANLSYLEVSNSDTKIGLLRADGNLALGLNQIVHLKGGLNVTKLTSGASDSWKPALGIQAGVGLQATRNLGFDLGYVVMSQTAESEGRKVDLALHGIELGVNGTF